MHDNQTSWTERFIYFVFALIAVVVVASVVLKVTGSGPANQAQAEAAARAYAAALYPGPTARVQCQGVDTDNNGYVSCTLVLDGTPPVTYPLECANSYAYVNTGCRPMRLALPPTQ